MKAYQFKITLRHSHPPIWRRIVIPACMSFEMFSDIIQKLFGFEGYHPDEFYFRDMNVSLQKTFNPDNWHAALVMGRHPLEEFETARKFTYTYDFGDDWEFEILREKILKDYPNNYPTLLKYKGDNLVEDCGGVYGYAELKRAWENPMDGNPELLEWAGAKEDYDFDPEAAEKILKGCTCDENGKFILREGLDEEEEYDETEEEAYLEEIRKALREDMLHHTAERDPENPANLLFNMIRDPDDMEKLMNFERLPKSLQEMKFAVSYAAMNTLVHAAKSVSRKYGIPAEEVIESFDLDPQGMNTVKMMLEDDEEEEDIPY